MESKEKEILQAKKFRVKLNLYLHSYHLSTVYRCHKLEIKMLKTNLRMQNIFQKINPKGMRRIKSTSELHSLLLVPLWQLQVAQQSSGV